MTHFAVVAIVVPRMVHYKFVLLRRRRNMQWWQMRFSGERAHRVSINYTPPSIYQFACPSPPKCQPLAYNATTANSSSLPFFIAPDLIHNLTTMGETDSFAQAQQPMAMDTARLDDGDVVHYANCGDIAINNNNNNNDDGGCDSGYFAVMKFRFFFRMFCR